MATELPDEVDCRQLADEARSISGSMAPARLTQISGVFRLGGSARVRLDFRRDDDERIAIDGEIDAPVEAQCQRCLKWMSLELCITVCALAMPSADDDFAYEQNLIAAPEGQLKLADMVEDEILLACPMIPVHVDRSCDSQADSGPRPDERYKPFAGLADLIKKKG